MLSSLRDIVIYDLSRGVHEWGYPRTDGLFHGTSQSKMDDDWGYPHLWNPPYGLKQLKNWDFSSKSGIYS